MSQTNNYFGSNFFKNVPSLISGTSGETLLAVLPTLLGAYEQGRGAPMGNVLTAIGGLLSQHAQYRQSGQTADAMENYLKNVLRPGSMAETEYKQFQPIQGQFNPQDRLAMLQNFLGEAQSEAGKKNPRYYNKNTNQWESHDQNEFPNGVIPPYLIPEGQTATKLQQQHLGLPSSEALGQEQIDALALAATGGKQNFKQLMQTNPAMAAKVVDQYRTAGAQTRANIQYQNYERERSDKLSDEITRLTVSNNNTMDRMAKMFAATTSRMIEMPGEKLLDPKTAHNFLDPAGNHIKGPMSANDADKAGYSWHNDKELLAIESARGAYTALNKAKPGLELLKTSRLGSYGNAELANLKGDHRVVDLLQANLAMLAVATTYSNTLRINTNELAIFRSLQINKSDTVQSAGEKMTQLKNQLGAKLEALGFDPEAVEKATDKGPTTTSSDDDLMKALRGK